jgi:hypothetical protein
MTNEPLRETLVSVFEHLKQQDEAIASLQRDMSMLRDTLKEMEPDHFAGTLERVRERWMKRPVERTHPGDVSSSQEYDEIIRKLKAGEVC